MSQVVAFGRCRALLVCSRWCDCTRYALYRPIEFEDFVRTFGPMTEIAITAEKRNHHPEWSNVYNRLEIWLTTHDAPGVSQRDVDIACQIDRLLSAD
ncbi:MAG: 4a-hydroxytetrahydrobiopterin dehydratase [Sphingopyxis sp.]|nr:4a-hydroxytetrahydrobiopterin dehydratase [Sphingopyxis sp.]